MSEEKFETVGTVRAYRPTDLAFIKATFLRGIYYGFGGDDKKGGEGWFGSIPKNIFMDNYSRLADALLANSLVNIACLTDDPDTIVGYSIVSNDFMTLHFVYVKKAWRRKGVARLLVPAHFNQATHLTALGRSLLKKFPTAVFNPFSI